MLINSDIKKILGGGYEVKEIKYMGNTVWKKPLEIIVTSIEDTKYFDKVGEYYHLKQEVCTLDTVMFISAKFDSASSYELNYEGYTISSENFIYNDEILVGKNLINNFPTVLEFEEGDSSFISEIGFKPLIDTKIIKTIVLAKNVTENNLQRVKEEVYKIYNESK